MLPNCHSTCRPSMCELIRAINARGSLHLISSWSMQCVQAVGVQGKAVERSRKGSGRARIGSVFRQWECKERQWKGQGKAVKRSTKGSVFRQWECKERQWKGQEKAVKRSTKDSGNVVAVQGKAVGRSFPRCCSGKAVDDEILLFCSQTHQRTCKGMALSAKRCFFSCSRGRCRRAAGCSPRSRTAT